MESSRSSLYRVNGYILEKSIIVRFSSLILDLKDWKMFLTKSRSSAKTTTGSSLMHLMYEPVQSW